MRFLSASAFAFSVFYVPAAGFSQASPAPNASPAPTPLPASPGGVTPSVRVMVSPQILGGSMATLRSNGMIFAQQNGAGPTLSISGKGSVSRTPDRATMTIQISAQGDTPENVIAAVASTTRDVQKSIERLNGAHITTTNSQLNLYGYNGNAQVNGSTSLDVTIDDIRSVAGIRTAVSVSPGVVVSNVRYDVSDRADANAEALAAALKDARAQFAVLAAKTNLKLVKIASISDTVYGGQNADSATGITVEAMATVGYEVSAP